MPTPLTQDLVRDTAAYIDDWLGFRQRHTRVPGVQAAIWAGGELVLSTAHGLADETSATPLRPDHAFRVASHSKTFTATVLGQLAAEGRLRLDDRLIDHLPWIEGSAIADRTIASVLAHAGGITRDTAEASWWWLEAPFPSRESLREIAFDDPAVTDSDVSMKYSNVGFALLGNVVEEVTGRPWSEELIERIVDPLDLDRTGPDWYSDLEVPFATAHSGLMWADRRVPIDQVGTGSYAPATGVWSTASDLCRYLAGHLPGGGLLDESVRRRMQRPVHDVPGIPGRSYALGFATGTVAGRRVVGHGGGWPGHISNSWLLPDDGVVVSVCTNAIDGPAQILSDGIIKLLDLASRRKDDRAIHDRAPVGDVAVDGLVGRWAGLWGVYDVAVLGGDALILDPLLADPTGVETVLVPEGEVFRIGSTPGYANPGEVVFGERGADGRVVALRAGGARLEPIDSMSLPERYRAPT